MTSKSSSTGKAHLIPALGIITTKLNDCRNGGYAVHYDYS